jgi:hypothetical protein
MATSVPKTIDLEKEMEVKDIDRPAYNPTKEQVERRNMVYRAYDEMNQLRRQTWPQFNNRTLRQFIDDSEKRLNAFVRTREEQGKELWQANYATRVYANKAKALLASVARQLPQMNFAAVDFNDKFDHFAAEMAQSLVVHSNNQGNPQEEMFFLAWSCVGKGTVVSYEGYERQNYVKKRIKSYDVLTGDVEEEEVERVSSGEPVSFEIPLTDLLIRNWFIRDVQKQPDIIWESYYSDKERFLAQWGNYPNAKYVKDAGDFNDFERETFFHSKWVESLGASRKGYLIMRYMNKYLDRYIVYANGVELYNGPIPWSDITRENFGKKAYPMAKTIYEPFADGNFFYGNSLVNSSMGEGDILNTLWNSAMDKTYRSLVPPLLVGDANGDALDLEDDIVAGDTKIRVPDINQIKQLEMRGVTEGELRMIDLVSGGIDLTTLDPAQQGVPQKYVTARASVAADERARQLKGLFFMFMESLWLQKTRLRTPNVIMAYGQPRIKKIIGLGGVETVEKKDPVFNIRNAQLSDGTRGVLSIEIKDKKEIQNNAEELMKGADAEETENRLRGVNFEKAIFPYGYLDNLAYYIEIIPESMHEQNQSLFMALVLEKVEIYSKLFPEYFADNKEKFFREISKAYRDDPNKYDIRKPLSFEEQQQLEIAKRNSNRNGAPGEMAEQLGGGTNIANIA